jgi:hypothetical protein
MEKKRNELKCHSKLVVQVCVRGIEMREEGKTEDEFDPVVFKNPQELEEHNRQIRKELIEEIERMNGAEKDGIILVILRKDWEKLKKEV